VQEGRTIRGSDEEYAAPLKPAAGRNSGMNRLSATAILSEIGIDMSRFPTPNNYASGRLYVQGIVKAR